MEIPPKTPEDIPWGVPAMFLFAPQGARYFILILPPSRVSVSSKLKESCILYVISFMGGLHPLNDPCWHNQSQHRDIANSWKSEKSGGVTGLMLLILGPVLPIFHKGTTIKALAVSSSPSLCLLPNPGASACAVSMTFPLHLGSVSNKLSFQLPSTDLLPLGHINFSINIHFLKQLGNLSPLLPVPADHLQEGEAYLPHLRIPKCIQVPRSDLCLLYLFQESG